MYDAQPFSRLTVSDLAIRQVLRSLAPMARTLPARTRRTLAGLVELTFEGPLA
jgi:hypothetical protein